MNFIFFCRVKKGYSHSRTVSLVIAKQIYKATLYNLQTVIYLRVSNQVFSEAYHGILQSSYRPQHTLM